jgi:hypothetical protein
MFYRHSREELEPKLAATVCLATALERCAAVQGKSNLSVWLIGTDPEVSPVFEQDSQWLALAALFLPELTIELSAWGHAKQAMSFGDRLPVPPVPYRGHAGGEASNPVPDLIYFPDLSMLALAAHGHLAGMDWLPPFVEHTPALLAGASLDPLDAFVVESNAWALSEIGCRDVEMVELAATRATGSSGRDSSLGFGRRMWLARSSDLLRPLSACQERLGKWASWMGQSLEAGAYHRWCGQVVSVGRRQHRYAFGLGGEVVNLDTRTLAELVDISEAGLPSFEDTDEALDRRITVDVDALKTASRFELAEWAQFAANPNYLFPEEFADAGANMGALVDIMPDELKGAMRAMTAMMTSKSAAELGDPLFQAVDRGDVEALDALLIADDVNRYGPDGRTPLLIAIEKNNAQMVAALLDRGADIERPLAINKHSPLICALQTFKTESAIVLLNRGASLQANAFEVFGEPMPARVLLDANRSDPQIALWLAMNPTAAMQDRSG